ncbi:MAG: PorT family protein [Muribaculum sp.]|nr:PorT family protein [Muribaculum sp.]
MKKHYIFVKNNNILVITRSFTAYFRHRAIKTTVVALILLMKTSVSTYINPRWLRGIIVLVAAVCAVAPAMAQQRNDKVLNRPYADLRRWHLGFSVGVNAMDLRFSHSGFVTEGNETWFVSQPSASPGFCVNGLFDLRLNDYFSLRTSPGLWFGNNNLTFYDTTNGTTERQDVKRTLLLLPLDVKFASQRYHNVRPYLTAGAMATLDLAKRKARDPIHLKPGGFMLTAGFGIDIYLPYFKFCPELKFCFGLSDMMRHDRPDLDEDPDRMKFTQSIKKATQQMVVLTFYFE